MYCTHNDPIPSPTKASKPHQGGGGVVSEDRENIKTLGVLFCDDALAKVECKEQNLKTNILIAYFMEEDY